jgi:hypothetical protein
MSNNNIPKFNINYVKPKPLDIESLEKSFTPLPEDTENNYNPFQIKGLQTYNPIYSLYFELSEKSYNKISLNHKYHFVNMDTVMNIDKKTEHHRPVFIKYSPLIDPFRYMTGKYKADVQSMQTLPNPFSSVDPLPKIAFSNNASYTDNFFSYLASKFMHEHNFVHGVDYYGSFLGIQEKFKVNITDDLDYLTGSSFFSENSKKLFTLTSYQQDEFMNFGSRSNKSKLIIDDSPLHNISIDEIDSILDNEVEDIKSEDPNELVYEKEKSDSSRSHSSSSSCSRSRSHSSTTSSYSKSSSTNYSVDEDDNESKTNDDDEDDKDEEEWETDDESMAEEDEPQQYAFVNNFPVQLICLEKCDGTMDELFCRDLINVDIGAAALMQIIMTLIAYQKSFHFTHNDLHTNNIMYINTNIRYLYYKYNKQIYKVPTYGKIYKIIDFGRSIYKFNGQLLFSDSFSAGNDAATQYNCEPYMNEKKSRIDPNYSFDLCRLGCSIYDFIIDNDDNPNRFDELQNTIYRWCLDDNGKNVLYKKNGDERYPNFKLYKMIARSVHHHTPTEQLNYPMFKQFEFMKKVENIENIMDIDSYPVYI